MKMRRVKIPLGQQGICAFVKKRGPENTWALSGAVIDSAGLVGKPDPMTALCCSRYYSLCICVDIPVLYFVCIFLYYTLCICVYIPVLFLFYFYLVCPSGQEGPTLPCECKCGCISIHLCICILLQEPRDCQHRSASGQVATLYTVHRS